MSANNQTLVKEYKGKWYVFGNVNAESWGWDEVKDEPAPNYLYKINSDGVFDTRDEAYDFAKMIDHHTGEFGEGTEYGVQFNRTCKDDGAIEIVE